MHAVPSCAGELRDVGAAPYGRAACAVHDSLFDVRHEPRGIVRPSAYPAAFHQLRVWQGLGVVHAAGTKWVEDWNHARFARGACNAHSGRGIFKTSRA